MTRSVRGEGIGDGAVRVETPATEVCSGCHCGRAFSRQPSSRTLDVNGPGPGRGPGFGPRLGPGFGPRGPLRIEATESNILLATVQTYGVPWLLLVGLSVCGYALAGETGAGVGAVVACLLIPRVVRRFGRQWAWRYQDEGSIP